MVAIIGALTEEEIEELKKIFVTIEDYKQLIAELKDMLGKKEEPEELEDTNEETEEPKKLFKKKKK